MAQTPPIYRKSPRGQQAIAVRDASLPPRARSLLIVVDGKKTHAELIAFATALGDPQVFAHLVDNGYIEPVAPLSTAGGAVDGAPVPAETAPPAPVVSLRDAQRFAVRRLTDRLGPSAEGLCMKIEGTKNAADFMALMKTAEQRLRDVGGNAIADDFARDLAAHRPA